jgi:putative protein-disulfide isomerase
MGRVGAHGFPTLLLETEGRILPVDISAYLGRAEAFASWLQQQTPNNGLQPGADAFQCGPESCEIRVG